MNKLLAIFLIAVVQVSFGQKPLFQTYTLLKKNESVKVNTIYQDRTGFLWYGTDRGLFKFDGLRYRNYTSLHGLPDNNVTAIQEDSLGRIWTGHQNGKLAFLENEVIKTFNPPEGSATKEISDILFDKKGRLWFATLDEGLYYFWNNRLYLVDEVDGMPDLFVHDLELDRKGIVWAGTDRGLVACTFQAEQISLQLYNNSTGLPDNIIRKIKCDDHGDIWLATEDAGLLKYDAASNTFNAVFPNWHYGAIADVLVEENEIWLSIDQSGLMVYDFNQHREKFYDGKVDKRFTSVSSLLKDHEGNIWLACKDQILRMPGHSVEHVTFLDDSNEESVTGLTVDKQLGVWYALNGKLHYEGPEPGALAWINSQGWANRYVSSLYVDTVGQLWIGFFGQGVVRINPALHQLTTFPELNTASVLSITGDDQSIWLATLSGAVQISNSGKGRNIKYYTKNNGLSTDYIYQVFVDSQNRAWLGTDGKGVDMIDKQGIHHYQEGLHSKVVYGFAEDGTHLIWVNIQGEGIYQFDGAKFIPLANKGNQLGESEISCLSADKNGNLVAMHDEGLDIYDVKQNKVFHVGEEIGLDNFKPTLNALATDRYGSLYFGTSKGIIRYTGQSENKAVSPSPYIENLKVMDKDISPKGEKLAFRYNQNEVTLHYVGFWYQNTENLHYRYRLEGFDRNWIDSRDAATTYSDLPPGDYTFHLKVSDSDYYSAEEAVVAFRVAAPFWKTWWFYAICAIAFLLVGYATVKYREKNLLTEKRELEEKVRERTLEIQKKNEEIQAQSEEIIGINENLESLVQSRTAELQRKNKALEEYAFITAHELRAPLASILGLVNILCKVKLDKQDQAILDHLRESSEKLESIVRTITEAIEKGDQPPTLEN